MLGPVRADQIEVLVQRIGRAPVPGLADLLLRRNDFDKLAELPAQVTPALLHVLDQRLLLVLREDGNLADAGVHAIGKHEIDNAKLAAEGCGGLAAIDGEALQAFAAAAGHHDRQGATGQAADKPSVGGARWLSLHGGPLYIAVVIAVLRLLSGFKLRLSIGDVLRNCIRGNSL